MTHAKHQACTTILVGKKASFDGSTMIARNEDNGSDASNPQKFVVIPPAAQPTTYKAVASSATFKLPSDPLRYTATPDADDRFGIWGESGINSANVAMSATETSTTNATVLSIDPFVSEGIGEADFLTVTLPYSHSARAAVKRLGQLLETYGTYEANGVAFSDQDEVWYMETIGGHHWAAIKVPDDAYVVAPNHFNITTFDFSAPDTLYAKDLPQLIEKYHLNPDHQNPVNLRHIFGSATAKDNLYNNPRAWDVQRCLNPSLNQVPQDHDLPFSLRPERKITVAMVKAMLSRHFQDTPYDPYGDGPAHLKHKFRPIALNRNQEVHVLQIRPNVPQAIAGIHWLAYGPNTSNTLVPFYTTITDTPARYRDTTTTFDLQNMYWLNRSIGILADANPLMFLEPLTQFKQTVQAKCGQIQLATEAALAEQSDVAHYLTQQNQKMAEFYFEQATQLLGQLFALSATKMKLRYNLAD